MEAHLRELGFEPLSEPPAGGAGHDSDDDFTFGMESPRADPPFAALEEEFDKILGIQRPSKPSSPSKTLQRDPAMEARTEKFHALLRTAKPRSEARITPDLVLELSNAKTLEKARDLDLSSRELRKIENLDKCTNLTKLDLACNNITKIHGLERLSKLRELSLFSNKIVDITGLDGLINLECLYLQDNMIESMAGLLSLRKLTTLDLSKNRISEVSCLDSSKQLTMLNLSGNQLSSLKGLLHLNKLEELVLHHNLLSAWPKGISQAFRELRHLNVSYNAFKDASGLRNIPKLSTLAMERNQVASLREFPRILSLRDFVVAGNALESVSGVLAMFPQLEVLDVRDNQIPYSRAGEFLAFTHGNLFSLAVAGNPCCSHSQWNTDAIVKATPSLRLLDTRPVNVQDASDNPGEDLSEDDAPIFDPAIVRSPSRGTAQEMKQIEYLVDEVTSTINQYGKSIDNLFKSVSDQLADMNPKESTVLVAKPVEDDTLFDDPFLMHGDGATADGNEEAPDSSTPSASIVHSPPLSHRPSHRTSPRAASARVTPRSTSAKSAASVRSAKSAASTQSAKPTPSSRRPDHVRGTSSAKGPSSKGRGSGGGMDSRKQPQPSPAFKQPVARPTPARASTKSRTPPRTTPRSARSAAWDGASGGGGGSSTPRGSGGGGGGGARPGSARKRLTDAKQFAEMAYEAQGGVFGGGQHGTSAALPRPLSAVSLSSAASRSSLTSVRSCDDIDDMPVTLPSKSSKYAAWKARQEGMR